MFLCVQGLTLRREEARKAMNHKIWVRRRGDRVMEVRYDPAHGQKLYALLEALRSGEMEDPPLLRFFAAVAVGV